MLEEIQENILENNFNNIDNFNIILKEGNSIRINDIIIHIEYGIGKFIGIQNIEFNSVANDFLKIEYADNVNLLVPVENFDLITKYSSYNENIKLDNLSKQHNWLSRKDKIRKTIKDLSKKLIDIACIRKIKKAPIFLPNFGSYDEFCNSFMFEPTEDQVKATNDIIHDLSSGKLMDRLLCGDVGFGKTEVAIRASFVVVDNKNKGQVAVIVPTTLLCRQHYKKFCERFKDTNYKIAMLSRLTSNKDSKIIKNDLELGNIDIIIGTHSLLGKNIKFKNLSLAIIDEEQSFGVSQKEKIKNLKTDVHILSMSATPIPRTLQMSVSGIKDLSLITTPPLNRVNVETIVCQYDDNNIKEIINYEIKRGGRIFFVVPRIIDIVEVENRLKNTIDGIKYCSINGKMNNETVDILMNDFYDGKYDVLISTTIIESGIDVPIANTIIIYKANNFGLTQLYQLRGRVGRSGVNAFAYLTTKKSDIISDISKKRLEIIESIKDLNSGFVISSQDMDIRGVGNVLGEEQSGHIKDVGIELYNDMLTKAIKNNNNDSNNNNDDCDFSPEIKLNISTIIPNNYIDNINIKMKYYKDIASVESNEQAEKIIEKMKNEYGPIPESVNNLFKVVFLKNKCKNLNISKLTCGDNSISISFYGNKFIGIDKLINYSNNDKNIKIKQNYIVFNFYNNDIFSNADYVLKIINSCCN